MMSSEFKSAGLLGGLPMNFDALTPFPAGEDRARRFKKPKCDTQRICSRYPLIKITIHFLVLPANSAARLHLPPDHKFP